MIFSAMTRLVLSQSFNNAVGPLKKERVYLNSLERPEINIDAAERAACAFWHMSCLKRTD